MLARHLLRPLVGVTLRIAEPVREIARSAFLDLVPVGIRARIEPFTGDLIIEPQNKLAVDVIGIVRLVPRIGIGEIFDTAQHLWRQWCRARRCLEFLTCRLLTRGRRRFQIALLGL